MLSLTCGTWVATVSTVVVVLVLLLTLADAAELGAGAGLGFADAGAALVVGGALRLIVAAGEFLMALAGAAVGVGGGNASDAERPGEEGGDTASTSGDHRQTTGDQVKR